MTTKGILKKSKYSTASTVTATSSAVQTEPRRTKKGANNTTKTKKKLVYPSPPLVKDVVLERKNPKADEHPTCIKSNNMIEGYLPLTCNNDKDRGKVIQAPSYPQDELNKQDLNNQNEIIASDVIPVKTEKITASKIKSSKKNVRSISELISQRDALSLELAALNINENQIKIQKELPTVVEADVSFTCMSSQQYQENPDSSVPTNEIAKENIEPSTNEIMPNPFGGRILFDDAENPADDDDDDDDTLDFFMDHDEEETESSSPKPFIILWSVLSTWITPNTVEYISSLENQTKPNSTNTLYQDDISSSRHKGLLSVINLYLPQCWNILNTSQSFQRIIESRLQMLISTFDFSLPMPNHLDTDLWKCLLVVFMFIVDYDRILSKKQPLEFVEAVGLGEDEFSYLVERAVCAFQSNSV